MATQDHFDSDFNIAEYCGNLGCHEPIVQPAGRGRRREFCSEVCRRAADRDYKRAKKMVEHFERNLRKSRHEVAAYGRKAEADGSFLTPEDEAELRLRASSAVSRAEAAIEFSAPGSNADFRQELERLVEAVRPMTATDRARLTA